MDKSVLMSLQPEWSVKVCNQIGERNGKPLYEKRIEVRKSVPKLKRPFKVYIYITMPKRYFTISGYGRASNEYLWLSDGKVKMSDGFEFWGNGAKYECLNGKVIGEFMCRGIMDGGSSLLPKESCLTIEEILNYAKGKRVYGWRIADLKIYDKPKELSEFKRWNRTEENAPCAHTKWLFPDCKDCKECNLTRPPQSWCYVEELKGETI